VAFDDPRGLGVVRADDDVDYPFHCTAITDGTRTIELGTAVAFRVRPGRLGRWEATDVRPA
jgi:cold shock CspA family protein